MEVACYLGRLLPFKYPRDDIGSQPGDPFQPKQMLAVVGFDLLAIFASNKMLAGDKAL